MAGTNILFGEEDLQSILVIEGVPALVHIEYFDALSAFDWPKNENNIQLSKKWSVMIE